MKAPAFWYQPESFAARLLSPLSYLYRLGALLRRFRAKPYQANVPVICVGNVTAGGSGKTPTALALAGLLQKQGHKPVFVTRGYGGSQRGPLRVDATHHIAEDVGDEALLLVRQAPVWIGRNRAAAIQQAEKEATHIILDDGLQNPHIKPDLSLLVMDSEMGIGNGHIIPAGPLREPLAEALQRVAAVLMVGEENNGKNNGIPLPLAGGVRGGLANTSSHFTSPPSVPPASGRDAEGKPILHARFHPLLPSDFPRTTKFLAFAGIGKPEKFYALCRKEGLTLAATEDFADHYPFTQNDLQTLKQKAKALGATLLTTEKDFVRLPENFKANVLTFPIRLEFDDPTAIEKLLYSTTTPNLPS